ncbi:hypothetical protein BN874_1840005 [Candidatus Contendobacter odensis Run_B_J11]|uniref:Uncharacterized protein n=1 Tax=Candidatus Contendobacter odensis Run_B_J11 TaxID=1400861 RepID=A0A7U7GAU8_9GAMM|nr:hypothetical protein BN874_1840005 [Candidatus Contendobacter odensis Run_B_J11]
MTLARSLYRRGYPRQEILELFRFIDWVLALPEFLEDQWTGRASACSRQSRHRWKPGHCGC